MYKKLMKRALVLMLLLSASSLIGQIKSISGTIRNAETLEPLPYANLVIKGTYLGGTSNVDGYFYLSGLDHDSVQVVCSYMGYSGYSKWFFYSDDSHLIIPIAMQPQTLGGEEVLVEDSLLSTPEVRLTTQIPRPDQPESIDLKTDTSPELLNYSYILSAPIQWLHPTGEFTRYIIDGVPVENSRHLYNVYPAFNLEAVKHVEDHPAGNIRQTCTDQVGATELIYREGNRAETDVRAVLGLVESGLTTSGPHPAGGSWYFSGRRIDFDALYSLSASQADSVYREFRPDYYFYDLNGKVTFDINEDTKASGNGYLTFDKLHWLGDQGRSAHSSWYNGFISSRLQHRFSPALSTQTILYAKTYHSFLRAVEIPRGLNQDLDGDLVNSLNTLGLSSQADYFLGGNNLLSVGASIEHLTTSLSYVDSSDSMLDKGLIFKAKTGYRYTLPYNLSTDLGLQMVYSGFSEKFALNPSFLLNWEPSNIYNAYLSMVQSTPMIRENSFSNTLNQPLFDILVPVDTTLPAPDKLTISMGGRFMPVIGYDLKAEFFSEFMTAPTLMDSAWNGDFSNQAAWLESYDKGNLTGINLSVEKLTPGFRALVKYRYSHATLVDQAGQSQTMPGHREHEFYAITDGHFKENYGYQLNLSLASGKQYLDENADWVWSSPYHRIDASVYREVHWERVQGKISFSLINLTNAGNSEYNEGSWIINGLQDRAFALLPFMPSIKFDFVF
jgi:hypothetical protein